MAGETPITIIGNLTADPELRFTPGSGDAVANFTVAATPRTFDRQSNEWKDGDTLFMRVAAWRELGENVAESIAKGMRVVVTGRLKSRQYETKEGEKRTVIEIEAEEVAPSLRYATATVVRAQRNGQGGQQGGQGGFGGGQQGGNWQGQQGGQQGGNWGGGQQAQGGNWGGQQGQQAGGFGGQQGGQWGGQQGQGQQSAAHYQQAAANGPGQGQQNTLQDDPWATPGVTNPGGQQGQQGGWGGQPQGGQQGGQNEPPF